MYHFLPSKQNEPGVGIKGLEKIFKIGLEEYHKLFVKVLISYALYSRLNSDLYNLPSLCFQSGIFLKETKTKRKGLEIFCTGT
jgi:hypothetical protein